LNEGVRGLPLLLLAAVGCSPVQGLPPHVDEPLLGATADATDTDVFLLQMVFNTGANTVCSAVLVSPRVLLTAAHCIDPAHQGATSVTVRAMNKPDLTNLMSTDLIDTVDSVLHPQWSAGTQQSPYDLAMVLLATAPTNATPRDLVRSPPASWTGQPLRLVGYGRTSATTSDSGTRRSQSLSITSATSQVLQYGVSGVSGICAGDSGGPGLWRGTDGVERVAGVHSYTLSPQCGDGADIRVDAWAASFIDPWIASRDAATCARDQRCKTGCAPADPDCVCAADGVCAAACPTLSWDPDCANCGANGTCSAVACPTPDPDCTCLADGVCQVQCPSGRVDPDCPDCGANGVCSAVGCPAPDPDCSCGADGQCQECAGRVDPDCPDCGANGVCSAVTCPTPDPDCAIDGDPCTAPAECAYHLCLPDPRGFSYCSRACTADSECIRDMKCLQQQCKPEQPPPLGPATGGCSAAPGLSPLLLALLALRRRRDRAHPER